MSGNINMAHNKFYVLGIDPGKNTGMALLNIKTEVLEQLWTDNFWGAIAYAKANAHHLHSCVVEVPDTKHVWQSSKGNTAALQRTAVHVGGVIREAEILSQGIELLGIKLIITPPRGKVDKEQFARLTGWTRQSNEHTRDAGLLCYQWDRPVK